MKVKNTGDLGEILRCSFFVMLTCMPRFVYEVQPFWRQDKTMKFHMFDLENEGQRYK